MTTKQAGAAPALADQFKNPAYSAYFVLRAVFTIAPIVMGLDKFFNLLTHPHHWSMYLASWIDNLVPGTADQLMYAVGVIEIVAGVIVAVAPRFGAWVVAAWLAGIIVDLVTGPGFYDVALRDFGLLVGAVALGLLAQGVHSGSITRR
ncbi:DoxX family membrane protein [Mycobacterium sp. 663a-19]|uniref:Rv2617c family stress response/phage resistance protein n=1 Tax=Mycobacterium sp. 663a-19 TaxID=2986148 RepID=UPI002D1F65A0|nr:DoxX family membrane protein [Mycobacterium sp. 663a-19]MEB3983139.1 DoxX family membrane protein [Mycobacterium sp. 663a-19]